MGQFTQHALIIPVPKKGEKCKVHRIKTHPLHRNHELLSVVNQSGKIKVHALVDLEMPPSTVDILVVGTNCEISEDLVDRIHKIGSLVLNDGQFGYHYYLVSPNEGSGSGKDELVVSLKYDDRKVTASDLEDIITPFHQELRIYGPSLAFEGNDTIVMIFAHSSARQSAEFKLMMSELYGSDLITSVNFS